MAILNNTGATDPRFYCRFCLQNHDVQEEQLSDSAPWNGYNRVLTITKCCTCEQYGGVTYTNSTNLKAKETKVAKQYDTTETKNLALNTIVSKVEALQRALYNRSEARAKVEALHAQHIADASTALNRALAEAYQAGIEEEDFSLHLIDYEVELSERLNQVACDMSLANVLEGV